MVANVSTKLSLEYIRSNLDEVPPVAFLIAKSAASYQLNKLGKAPDSGRDTTHLQILD